MKNNTLAQLRALDYFARLSELDAKKTLFAMERISGYEKMNDSKIPEVRHIAELHGGIILGNFVSSLSNSLANHYSNTHPGVLMTQKEAKEYTDVNYVKLFTNLGLRGFDYVMTVLRQGKAKVSDPESCIDEQRMLQAMRWDEQREDREPTISNNFHRKKGLELVGFDTETAELLLPHSFIIANIYDQVTATVQPVKVEITSVRQMKIHFIEAAEIIEEFYKVIKPVEPKGYDKAQLAEGSMLLDLANKSLLKDSETILEYYKAKVEWDGASTRLEKEFSAEECKVIRENPETVKELIKSTW